MDTTSLIFKIDFCSPKLIIKSKFSGERRSANLSPGHLDIRYLAGVQDIDYKDSKTPVLRQFVFRYFHYLPRGS